MTDWHCAPAGPIFASWFCCVSVSRAGAYARWSLVCRPLPSARNGQQFRARFLKTSEPTSVEGPEK